MRLTKRGLPQRRRLASVRHRLLLKSGLGGPACQIPLVQYAYETAVLGSV